MGLHPSPTYLAMGFTNPLLSLAALDNTYFYKFNWKNGMFGHASKRYTNLALKYGILTWALRCGPFGSNIMTRFSTKKWHELEVKSCIWEDCVYLCQKPLGERLSNSLRNAFRWRTSLLGNSLVGGHGASYVATTDSQSHGTRRSWLCNRLGLGE